MNEALRKELLAMFREDQAANAGTDFARTHNYQKTRLREIIDTSGWPRISQVGNDGALAAWIIVQHDDDLPWMKECLGMMEGLSDANEIRLEDIAYLRDRIAVMEGRPQAYGTQFLPDGDGGLIEAPILDPLHVDERRRSMDIPEPFADYKAAMLSRQSNR